jgi:hypothetical protein
LISGYAGQQKETYQCTDGRRVCVANMIARVWMWECDYGFAKHYMTFMASPLHECEYVAAYEEAEAIGIAVEYRKIKPF